VIANPSGHTSEMSLLASDAVCQQPCLERCEVKPEDEKKSVAHLQFEAFKTVDA